MSDAPRRVRALSYCEAHGLPRPTGEPSSNGAAAKSKTTKPSKATRPSKAIGQRFQTINNFVDSTMRRLKPTAALTWVVLWRDARNGIARTSQSDIATRIGVSRRSVITAIAELEEAGVIKRIAKGNSFKQCSAYEILEKPDTPN